VAADWWCGEGADAITGASYSNPVNGIPGANGAGYLATSATSVTVAASGSIALTTQTGLAYTVGARVRATSAGSGAWMEGVVSAYTGGVLTFTADSDSGSGTHADWNINLAGQPGATGPAGAGVLSSGSFTFTASPLVVADSAVTGSSKVVLWPTNNEAGLLCAGKGGTGNAGAPFISAVTAGASFTVTCSAAGGGGPVGTETFFYVVTA
jgi:hypothetical protein